MRPGPITTLPNSPRTPSATPEQVIPIDTLVLYYSAGGSAGPAKAIQVAPSLLALTEQRKNNISHLNLLPQLPSHLGIKKVDVAVLTDTCALRTVQIQLTVPRYREDSNLSPLSLTRFQQFCDELNSAIASAIPGLRLSDFLINRLDLFINIKQRFDATAYRFILESMCKLYYAKHRPIESTDYFYLNRLKQEICGEGGQNTFAPQEEYIAVYDKTEQLLKLGIEPTAGEVLLRFEVRLMHGDMLEKYLHSSKFINLLDNIESLRAVLSKYLLSSLFQVDPAYLQALHRSESITKAIEDFVIEQEESRFYNSRISQIQRFYRAYVARGRTGQCIVPLSKQNTRLGAWLSDYRKWCFVFSAVENSNPSLFVSAYTDLIDQVRDFAQGSPSISERFQPSLSPSDDTVRPQTLRMARTCFEQDYREALQSPASFHVFTPQPGVGKTYMTRLLIEEGTIKTAMIAIPRKELHQVEYGGIGRLYPDIPEFLEKAIRPARFAQTRQDVLIAKARRNASPQELAEISAYQTDLNGFFASPIKFVTHERLLRTPAIAATEPLLIIDEDPLNSILYLAESDSKRINRLNQRIKKELKLPNSQKIIESFQHFVRATQRLGSVRPNPILKLRVRFALQNMLDDMVTQNASNPRLLNDLKSIGGLTKSNHLLEEEAQDSDQTNTLHYGIQKRALPTVPKTIILSGTIDASLFSKHIVPGRQTNISSYPHIEHDSRLIQYYGYSFPRHLPSSKESYLIQVAQDAKRRDHALITHQSYVPLLRQHGIEADLYFGNLSGLNLLAGRNLTIIGTPFIPVYLLKLWAAALNLEHQSIGTYHRISDEKQKIAEFQGVRFRFPMLSRTRAIRELQLSYTYSELSQAVGRARHLEHAITIELFSSFALRGFQHLREKVFN